VGIKMAMNEAQDAERSYKDLKKMAKDQKKAKKKVKKKAKMEKKIAKKEAKMRKKGVFLDEVVTPEGPPAEAMPEEMAAQPWVRKSTDAIPYVERKIDRMAARTERSSLHDLFEEKYGESLDIPVTYKEYELSEAEIARLEEMGVGVEETKVSPPIEVGPMGAEGAAPSEVVEAEVEAPKPKKVKGEKPFYHPLNLWLYNNYGKDKMIVLKIIILIISIIGFIFLLVPRIIIFIIMTLVNKMRQRKAKKAAAKEAKKTATEA
jgi:hypothetical protein